MSNYYVRRTGDDEYLEHSWADIKRGVHKYLAKINVGGRVRYIYNQAQLAAARAGGAVSNARRSAGQFIDKNITGASARRGMNASRTRYNNLSSSGKAWARGGATRAKAAAQKYERSYNRSLAGRLANTANEARKFVGRKANEARKAGMNFAGTVSKNAYAAGNAARRKASKFVDQNITGSSAKRLGNTYRRGVKSANGMSAKNAALRNAKKYESQYSNSLAGRFSSARGAAGRAFTDAGERLSELTKPRPKKKKLSPHGLNERGQQYHNRKHAKQMKRGKRRDYIQ